METQWASWIARNHQRTTRKLNGINHAAVSVVGIAKVFFADSPLPDWFNYPQVQLQAGKWLIVPNPELQQPLKSMKEVSCGSNTPADLFEFSSRLPTRKVYEKYITAKIEEEVAQGTKFGALVMEPILLGAGGMVMP